MTNHAAQLAIIKHVTRQESRSSAAIVKQMSRQEQFPREKNPEPEAIGSLLNYQILKKLTPINHKNQKKIERRKHFQLIL